MRKAVIIVYICLIGYILCGMLTGCGHEHEWIEAKCDSPRICKVCNQTEGEALGHDWKDATCIEPKTCLRCGKTEGKMLGHDAPGLSCVDSAICIRCGEEVPALGHEWIEATCTEPKKCSRCGDTEGEALGHIPNDPVEENKKEATCTESGHYDEVIYCSVCHKEISREVKQEAALGHQFNNGVCTICGEKIEATLFEDTNIRITFKNAEKYRYSNDQVELYFYVENKTERTLLIQADAVSINGYCFCNLIMSDPVSAFSKGKINLTVKDFDSDIVDITKIMSLGGQFRIIDDDTWKSYDALFSNVKLDGSGIGSSPADFSNGNILYEDNVCAIYYKSISKYRYSNDEAELHLFVSNKTNKTILIQADAISINGYSYSNLIMSDEVLPNTIGTVDVSIRNFDFDIIDITQIKSLGGQLRIIDDASWNTYKAKLSNDNIVN